MSHEGRSRAARETLDARAELFTEATRNFSLPGGVITIADSSGVLAEIAFGHADPWGTVPMDASRRFEIGSISKLFTSLVVNRLVDDGRLGLDETLAEILPWVRLGPTSGTVTVARLLNHTSGLCVGGDAMADDAGEIVNSRHCVDAASAPTRFHYSNLGYLVLGEMVRARSGRRLSDLVTEQWLVPLGMHHALARVTQADRSSLAVGSWPLRPDQLWAPGDPLDAAAFFEIDSASGNVAARGTDMAALMTALLGASRDDPVRDEHGAPVLSHETFQRITTSLAPSGEPTYTVDGVDAVEDSRYGMGLNVERVGGHLCVSHGGGMVGYSTFMLVDCDAGVGVSVLTNANGDTLASHILARVLHADMVRRLEGGEPADEITLESRVTSLPDARIGEFVSTSTGERINLRVEVDGVHVRANGDEGDLFALVSGRYVTTHPGLRRFHWDWSDGRWIYGEQIFMATSASSTKHHARVPSEVVGHYRSFSPWFPEFRIIERDGQTLLVAPGGVEAPGEEVVLVALGDDEYRLGEDPWLPERIRVLARRDGEVVSVERDGCVYSRVFSA